MRSTRKSPPKRAQAMVPLRRGSRPADLPLNPLSSRRGEPQTGRQSVERWPVDVSPVNIPRSNATLEMECSCARQPGTNAVAPAWKDGVLLRSTPINCLLGAPALHIEGVAALNSPPADVIVLPGKWARIRAGQGGSGSAGPTGKPWVESNGWRVQLEGTLHPGREIWVDAQPPTGQVLPASAYLLMMADAEAFGTPWVVSLDESLSKKVADGESAAVESWKALTAAFRFFADHRQWSTYETIASTGVISDFAGGNRFLSHELLNLAARRAMPVRILPKAGAVSADLTGLRALVFLEAARTGAGEQLQNKLAQFVEGGGLLIAPERMIATA